MTITELGNTPSREIGFEETVTSGDPARGLIHIWKGIQANAGIIREGAIGNTLQGKATEVSIDVEWSAVQSLDVYRLAIIDNGCGMAPLELSALGRIDTSGEGRDLEENFGVGIKAAAYPSNPYGTVFISKKNGKVHMIWIHRERAGTSVPLYGYKGQFKARDIGREFLDPTDDVREISELRADLGHFPSTWTKYIPLHQFEEAVLDGVDWVKAAAPLEKYESGTMVILCGTSPQYDTILGEDTDVQNPEYRFRATAEVSKYGTVQWLNEKIFDISSTGARFTSFQFENWTGNKKGENSKPPRPVQERKDHHWPKSKSDRPKFKQMRDAYGVRGMLTTELKNHGGTYEVTEYPQTDDNPIAFRAHTWILGETLKANRGDSVKFPYFGVLYQAHDNIGEMLHTDDGAGGTMGTWIGGFPNVANLMALVIEPLEEPESDNIIISVPSDRSGLRYSSPEGSSMPMPFTAWKRAYKKRLPDNVKAAVKVERERMQKSLTTEVTDDDIIALLMKGGVDGWKHYVEAGSSHGGTSVTGISIKGGNVLRKKKKSPTPRPKTTCAEDGCSNQAVVGGYCEKHRKVPVNRRTSSNSSGNNVIVSSDGDSLTVREVYGALIKASANEEATVHDPWLIRLIPGERTDKGAVVSPDMGEVNLNHVHVENAWGHFYVKWQAEFDADETGDLLATARKAFNQKVLALASTALTSHMTWLEQVKLANPALEEAMTPIQDTPGEYAMTAHFAVPATLIGATQSVVADAMSGRKKRRTTKVA